MKPNTGLFLGVLEDVRCPHNSRRSQNDSGKCEKPGWGRVAEKVQRHRVSPFPPPHLPYTLLRRGVGHPIRARPDQCDPFGATRSPARRVPTRVACSGRAQGGGGSNLAGFPGRQAHNFGPLTPTKKRPEKKGRPKVSALSPPGRLMIQTSDQHHRVERVVFCCLMYWCVQRSKIRITSQRFRRFFTVRGQVGHS